MKEIGFDLDNEYLLPKSKSPPKSDSVPFPMEEYGGRDCKLEFEFPTDPTMRLLCPCGGLDLHQIETRTIFRKEDQDGTLTITNEEKTEIRPIPRSKIPGRRDVLGIRLWCESCHGTVYLCVRQHKGATLLYLAKDVTYG